MNIMVLAQIGVGMMIGWAIILGLLIALSISDRRD